MCASERSCPWSPSGTCPGHDTAGALAERAEMDQAVTPGPDAVMAILLDLADQLGAEWRGPQIVPAALEFPA